MCDALRGTTRGFVAAVLLGVLALGMPRGAAAQRTDVRPLAVRFAESARRSDSLSRLTDSLTAAAESAVPPLKLDEGLVHIRYDTSVSPRVLGLLRDAARLATSHITNIQGDAAPRTVGAAEFIAHERPSPWTGIREFSLRLRSAGGYQTLSATLPGRADRVSEYVERAAADIVTGKLAPAHPSRRLGAIPAARVTEAGWTEIAEWTASSPSSVARRCIGGDARECRRLLLPPGPVPTLDDWYEPADYPGIVKGHDWTKASPERKAIVTRCLAERDAGACSDAAHNMMLPYPVPLDAVHSSLVALALEIGGPKAIDRMMTAPADDIQRVEAAAGVPLDSLLAVWQRRVTASRPRHEVFGASFGVLWMTTLLFLIARRRPSCA